MLFSKSISEKTVGSVQMANGKVTFRQIQLNTYSFAIDGLIIDAGGSSLRSHFLDFWKKQSIDSLYCTHIHEDHTGCADWFENQLAVPIYLNNGSIPEATRPGKYPIYRKLYWGKRKPFHPKPMPEHFSSRTQDWTSIYTPGHSYDHTALLNKTTGQLFSGDLYVQTKTKVAMENESIPDIIQSLETVLTYDFKEVFCCHAGYLENGRERLVAKLAYLKETEEHVLMLHEQGLPIKEIQSRLFPRKYPITFFSYGQWDSKHIIRSIINHA